MQKKLKDYLHLYGFCECVVLKGMGMTHRTTIIGMHENGNIQVAHPIGSQDYFNIEDVRPLLRTWSSLTKEEANNVGWEQTSAQRVGLTFEEFKEVFIEAPFLHVDEFAYALKLGLDIFGLIDSGLAFDKATL